MLSGHCLAVQTAPGFQGRAFDFLPLTEDRVAASAIDVFRRQIVQALMISPRVVVSDELPDTLFELSGQVVVVEQDLVFQ